MNRTPCTIATWPTPSEIVNAPELASLAIVEHALEILGRVLAVTYPELFDAPRTAVLNADRLTAAAACALDLLRRREQFLDAIGAYRRTVAPARFTAPHDDTGFPF